MSECSRTFVLVVPSLRSGRAWRRIHLFRPRNRRAGYSVAPGPGTRLCGGARGKKQQQQPRSALGRNGERYDAARKKSQKKSGGAGYRSRYLPHAKRALYHLSYAPIQTRWQSADLARHKADEGTARIAEAGRRRLWWRERSSGSRAEHKRWTRRAALSGGGRSEAESDRGWACPPWGNRAAARLLGGGACSAGRLPWVGMRARADE